MTKIARQAFPRRNGHRICSRAEEVGLVRREETPRKTGELVDLEVNRRKSGSRTTYNGCTQRDGPILRRDRTGIDQTHGPFCQDRTESESRNRPPRYGKAKTTIEPDDPAARNSAAHPQRLRNGPGRVRRRLRSGRPAPKPWRPTGSRECVQTLQSRLSRNRSIHQILRENGAPASVGHIPGLAGQPARRSGRATQRS